eukprot:274273-Chlamydomonas_euryale.AAC.1
MRGRHGPSAEPDKTWSGVRSMRLHVRLHVARNMEGARKAAYCPEDGGCMLSCVLPGNCLQHTCVIARPATHLSSRSACNHAAANAATLCAHATAPTAVAAANAAML